MDDLSLPGADHATLRHYLQRLEDNIRQISRRLKRFEDEFGMDSEEFYAKLQNAELDERVEYSEARRAEKEAREPDQTPGIDSIIDPVVSSVRTRPFLYEI